jgi:nucleoside-diphosphate-sugar epimerase
MRVLLAGVTGVIGRQAAAVLTAAGHEVIGLARSERNESGPPIVAADILDAEATSKAVTRAAPDAIVHVATAIPDPVNPRRIGRDMAATNLLRTQGTANLIAAARRAGSARIVAESLAYAYDPAGDKICDETQPLWHSPPRPYAPAVAAIRDLEAQVVESGGVALRIGHLYGPGSTYAPDGAAAAQIRAGKFPIVGDGGAVFSFAHAEDVATAIRAAVESDYSGALNIVDDDPAAVRDWLPEVARLLGGPQPKTVPTWLARIAVGPFGAAFMTALRGADNTRAREALGWAPRRASWRDGFAGELSAERAAMPS